MLRSLLATESAAAAHKAHEEFTFEQFLALAGFLFTVYALGKAGTYLQLPELVGNLLAGILLGPELGKAVLPDAFALETLGEIGFWLLLIEAGLEVNLPLLLTVGSRGLAVAVLGVTLPLGIGTGLAVALGLNPKSAFATATIIAPTSASVVISVLRKEGMLNTPTGQLVMSAAVFDDLISLVILAELKALNGGTFATIGAPIISSLGYLALFGYLAVFQFPKLMSRVVLPRIPGRYREVGTLAIVFGLAAGLGAALYYSQASRYLGVFLAGLSFCTIHTVHSVVWHEKVAQIQQWGVRLFFACTIGFVIPIRKFWTAAVWTRTALLLIPLFSKVATGVFAPQPKRTEAVKIGTAMCARGEFSFVIAQVARSLNLLDPEWEAAALLTVLISIVVVPVALYWELKYFAHLQQGVIEAAHNLARKSAPRGAAGVSGSIDQAALEPGLLPPAPRYFRITLKSQHAWRLLDRFMRELTNLRLEIVDFRCEYIGDLTVLETFVRDLHHLPPSKSTHDLHAAAAPRPPIHPLKRAAEARDALSSVLSSDAAALDATEAMAQDLEEAVKEQGDVSTGAIGLEEMDAILENYPRGLLVAPWDPAQGAAAPALASFYNYPLDGTGNMRRTTSTMHKAMEAQSAVTNRAIAKLLKTSRTFTKAEGTEIGQAAARLSVHQEDSENEGDASTSSARTKVKAPFTPSTPKHTDAAGRSVAFALATEAGGDQGLEGARPGPAEGDSAHEASAEQVHVQPVGLASQSIDHGGPMSPMSPAAAARRRHVVGGDSSSTVANLLLIRGGLEGEIQRGLERDRDTGLTGLVRRQQLPLHALGRYQTDARGTVLDRMLREAEALEESLAAGAGATDEADEVPAANGTVGRSRPSDGGPGRSNYRSAQLPERREGQGGLRRFTSNFK